MPCFSSGNIMNKTPRLDKTFIFFARFQDQMMDKLLHKIDKELSEVARRETKSVLRKREYPGLCSFTFEEILSEMQSLCPTVFKTLSSIIQLDLNRDKNTAPLALIYGVMMFKRCHELSRLQRLNTVLLSDGNASKEVIYNIKLISVLFPEVVGTFFVFFNR